MQNPNNNPRGNYRPNAPIAAPNQRWRNQRPNPTPDQIRAKSEKVLARDAKFAEARKKKEENKAQWPNIQVDYEPEVWRQKYQDYHGKLFYQSVDRLAQMRALSHEEAEKTLLEVLIKVTFIETNLTVNGDQTPETLFDNLELAQNGHPSIPFTSPEDVAEFCKSMPLNFRREGLRYRNTGVQGRRLVQELKNRLELGDEVSRGKLDEIISEFRKTINVPAEGKNFADQEAFLDYSSLFHMAKTIPGFHYDKTTHRLSLTPEASESLILNLPIFTDTINSSHVFKLDYSRHVSGFAISLRHMYPSKTLMNIQSEEMHNLKTALFRKHNRGTMRNIDLCDKNQTFVHCRISPNNGACQLEVFTVEPSSFCYLNNLCTQSSGKILDKATAAMKDADFENVNKHIKAQRNWTKKRDTHVDYNQAIEGGRKSEERDIQ